MNEAEIRDTVYHALANHIVENENEAKILCEFLFNTGTNRFQGKPLVVFIRHALEREAMSKGSVNECAIQGLIKQLGCAFMSIKVFQMEQVANAVTYMNNSMKAKTNLVVYVAFEYNNQMEERIDETKAFFNSHFDEVDYVHSGVKFQVTNEDIKQGCEEMKENMKELDKIISFVRMTSCQTPNVRQKNIDVMTRLELSDVLDSLKKYEEAHSFEDRWNKYATLCLAGEKEQSDLFGAWYLSCDYEKKSRTELITELYEHIWKLPGTWVAVFAFLWVQWERKKRNTSVESAQLLLRLLWQREGDLMEYVKTLSPAVKDAYRKLIPCPIRDDILGPADIVEGMDELKI